MWVQACSRVLAQVEGWGRRAELISCFVCVCVWGGRLTKVTLSWKAIQAAVSLAFKIPPHSSH